MGRAGDADVDAEFAMAGYALGHAELEAAGLDPAGRQDVGPRNVGDDRNRLAVDDDIERDRPARRRAAEYPTAAAVLIEPFQRPVVKRAEPPRAGRDQRPRRAMAERDLMLAAVEAHRGQRLGKAEMPVADALRLQFVAQPVGGDGPLHPPVDQHVERRAGRLAGSFAYPAAGGNVLDRLEDAVDLLGPEDQRRPGELDTVGEDADDRAGDEFLRRDGADKAAEAVVVADPGQFAAQAVGHGLRRQLAVDVEGDLDPAAGEIAVVGPAEHRSADHPVDRTDRAEPARPAGAVVEADRRARHERRDDGWRRRRGPGELQGRPGRRHGAAAGIHAGGRVRSGAFARAHASCRSTDRRRRLFSRGGPRRRSLLSS